MRPTDVPIGVRASRGRGTPAARGRAARLASHAPRLLLELDEASGDWVPVGVAENAAGATDFLNGK
ncbi:hypothetical protein ABT144_14575 [Streptomyces sp. NPDC002039]|uniref:hypothetical protein n=1 Tax=Streptomyces sp. NPDC002039 TaxID=3154660 RepID=UPI00331F0EFC